MVRLGEGSPAIVQLFVERARNESEGLFDSFKLDDFAFDWKKEARRRRVERELSDKYGYLKDFILNPHIQIAKQYIDDNIRFDFVLGEPLLPISTAIIVLFMMHKRVKNSLLGLIAAFIFNMNPMYVSIVLLLSLLSTGRRKPKKFNLARVAAKTTLDKATVAKDSVDSIANEAKFDHVLVGGNLSTLYTAALLAKCGHRCCVLQPSDNQKLEVSISFCAHSLAISYKFIRLFHRVPPVLYLWCPPRSTRLSVIRYLSLFYLKQLDVILHGVWFDVEVGRCIPELGRPSCPLCSRGNRC